MYREAGDALVHGVPPAAGNEHLARATVPEEDTLAMTRPERVPAPVQRRGGSPSALPSTAGVAPCLRAALALGLAAAFALLPRAGTAQDPEAPPDLPQERSEEEGRRISEYDFAVSNAMRALMAAGAEQRRVTVYVARKEGELWHVYFGSLDVRAPRFSVAYEVVQSDPGSAAFEVRRFEEDVEADTELTRAALALVTSLDAFEPPTVRFRTYVWRDARGRWVAYFAPASRDGDLDVTRRVVVTPDARQVLELRNLLESGEAPDSAHWVPAGPATRPTAADFVNLLLRPDLAPLAFVARRLVCELDWEGKIRSCLVTPIR